MTSDQHQPHCIDNAINHVRSICLEKGVRFTRLREQVFTLICNSHHALGAYDLIALLASASGKNIAPPTVYRALDFLLDIGIIHRINSLNAYISCLHPSTDHTCYFLICTHCHRISDCTDANLSAHIVQLGNDNHFTINKQLLEFLGLCQECQN
jgi:Fur family zinc uptake transcriptional regulator